MIQPEYVWKTLKWVNALDENNKKGMRILKTIQDIKGAKKFKPLEKENADLPQKMSPRNISPRNTGFSSFASSHGPDASSFDFEEFDIQNAKALYRKLNYQTSYSRQVGEPPKAQEEFAILKTKKFRDLEMSKFF